MMQELIEMERLVSELTECFETLKRKYNPTPMQAVLEFVEQNEPAPERKRKVIVGKVRRSKKEASENFCRYMIALWYEYRQNGKVENVSRLQTKFRIGKTPYRLIRQYVEKEQSPSPKDINLAAQRISNYYKENNGRVRTGQE